VTASYTFGTAENIEEAPGSTPQVLEDVDEVTDDRDLDAAAACLGPDHVDLVLRAVDESNPWTFMAGVTALCLVEGGSDDLLGGRHDARGEPFPRCHRCRCLLPVVASGEDVAGGAWHRGGVVDDGELGHALRVALLAFGEPRLQLVLVLAGGLHGGRAQGVGAHHDPLAVSRDDEHVGLGARLAALVVVEALDVEGSTPGEVFHLALGEIDAGRACDRRLCLLVAAPGRLDRRQLSEPVAVALGWQVQASVLEVKVLCSFGPVGEPGDGDAADDGLEAAMVIDLDRLVSDACGIDDRSGTALSGSAQVQVVLEQLAEQLPAAGGEAGLELVVGERPGLLAGEEADEGAVDRIRAAEGAR